MTRDTVTRDLGLAFSSGAASVALVHALDGHGALWWVGTVAWTLVAIIHFRAPR